MWEILNHLKIRVRLYLFFVLSLLLFVAFGWFAIYNLDSIHESVETIKKYPMTISKHVQNASESAIKMHRSMKDYILAVSSSERRVYLDQINELERDLLSDLDSVSARMLTEEGRQLVNQANREVLAWRSIRQDAINLQESGNRLGAKAITTGREDRQVKDVEKRFNALKKYTDEQADEFVEDARSAHNNTNFITIAGIVVVAVVFWFAAWLVSTSIVVPLRMMSAHIRQLSKGAHPVTSEMRGSDELVDMNASISDMVVGLRNTAYFAQEIGEGKLLAEFEALSEKDVLGNALLEMRKKLKLFSDEEKERHWIATGLANMSEELRTNQQSLEVMGENILSRLVPYLEAHQGALFIVENEEIDPELSLLAGYASNDSHIRFSVVKFGEGLIGQTAIEQEVLHIKQVPEDFIHISSALGDTKPNEVILVPLTAATKVYGVLELASIYEFKPHHIEFLTSLAESIATTIASVKSAEQTSKLLRESKDINQQVLAQEEKLRENNEAAQIAREDLAEKLRASEEEILRLQKEIEQLRNDG